MRRTSLPLSLLLMIAAVITVAISAITSASAQTAPAPGKIAFFSPDCGNSAGSCLAVIDANGANLANLTSTYPGGLAWSPDGTQLAFTNGNGLFIVPALGGTAINLASTGAYSPAWSPDGTNIAFASYGIKVVPASGGTVVNLPSPPESGSPAWSPDGKRIAFSTSSPYSSTGGLYVMNSDGSELMQLTTSVYVMEQPKWSPDGSRIVFTCMFPYTSSSHICVIHSDGSEFAVLTTNFLGDSAPDWSPDGAKIAYSAYTIDASGNETSVITLMNPDGSAATQLGSGMAGALISDLMWSPDGTQFAFTNSITYVISDIYGDPVYEYTLENVSVMNSDGSGVLQLPYGYNPAWQPKAISSPLAWFSSTCNGLTCNFDGSDSKGFDATITSYSWNFGDGSPAETGSAVTHTYAAAGSYKVTLTVTDSGGATDTQTNNVTVTAPNSPPVASFMVSCSSLACSFDGSKSLDSDGWIVQYAWTFGDGNTASATTATVAHTYAAAGTYSVTLTVTDNSGASGRQSNTVTVTNSPPVASFTFACSSLACNFDGSASRDSDGTIRQYAWNFGDNTTGLGTTATIAHTYAAAGTYSVTLTVTDNSGASGTQSNTVTVTAPNSPSVAAFSFSCSRFTCSFDGSASRDSDGWITQYAWNFGDGATGSGATIAHTYAGPGTYTVTLTVTDNGGATGAQANNVTVTRRK